MGFNEYLQNKTHEEMVEVLKEVWEESGHTVWDYPDFVVALLEEFNNDIIKRIREQYDQRMDERSGKW